MLTQLNCWPLVCLCTESLHLWAWSQRDGGPGHFLPLKKLWFKRTIPLQSHVCKHVLDGSGDLGNAYFKNKNTCFFLIGKLSAVIHITWRDYLMKQFLFSASCCVCTRTVFSLDTETWSHPPYDPQYSCTVIGHPPNQGERISVSRTIICGHLLLST